MNRDDIESGNVWPCSDIYCSVCGETRGVFIKIGEHFECLRHLGKLGQLQDRRLVRS